MEGNHLASPTSLAHERLLPPSEPRRAGFGLGSPVQNGAKSGSGGRLVNFLRVGVKKDSWDNVVETVEHLFFHCSFSKTCWQKLGVHWQQQGDRLQTLLAAKLAWRKPMFQDIFMTAAWSIWKERIKISSSKE